MKKLLVAVITLGIFSCGSPNMNSELVKSMTLGYENGIVCGISLGDDFNSIKEKIHKDWKIKEGSIGSFIKEWDGFNYIILSLETNKQGKLKNISYTITGKDENRVLIAEIERDLTLELNGKFPQKEEGSWDYQGSKEESYSLTMNKFIDEDTGATTLVVNAYQF